MPLPLCGQSVQPLQHLWEVQPNFGDIWFQEKTPRIPHIDVEGLASEHVSVLLDTARMITHNHDRDGFDNKSQVIALIIKALAQPDQPTEVQRAMMSAVCAIDDGQHAQQLWDLSRADPVLDRTLQHALIEWKNTVALEHWRDALQELRSSSEQALLAIEGLGAVGSLEDIDVLVRIVESDVSSERERFEAARAIGRIQPSGWNDLARRILASDIAGRDRIAVQLIRNDSTEESLAILRAVHDQGGQPAQREAADGIATHFRQAAVEMIPAWMKRSDMYFRKLALQVASDQGEQLAIDVACQSLQDEDSRLRQSARQVLRSQATAGYGEAVNQCLNQRFSGNEGRSLEQAIILAVELRDATRCERLLELLRHPQAEVSMHAAWALRELSEPGPILDAMIAYASEKTDRMEEGAPPLGKSGIIQLSFLLEAVGRHRSHDAYAMLVKYIPKNDFKMGNLTRASAIWSIGQLKKQVDDPALRLQLRERISDMPPDKPENYLVRYACILALGEFGFRDSLEIIDSYGGVPPSPLGLASNWARERIAEAGK
jgi:HEAT repeat protein